MPLFVTVMDDGRITYITTSSIEITAFSHIGDPVDERSLLSALFGVRGDDWAKTFSQFHLTRAHIVNAVAVILVRIDELMTSYNRK